MKKYIKMLVVSSLICYASVAQDIPPYFPTVEDLSANVKQVNPTNVSYDTSGFVVGVALPPGYSTDRNLHLLSQTRSISLDEYINNVDTNIFSRLDKLTNFVVTSDIDNPAVKEGVWKTPASSR